jgi:hypothetical protein
MAPVQDLLQACFIQSGMGEMITVMKEDLVA